MPRWRGTSQKGKRSRRQYRDLMPPASSDVGGMSWMPETFAGARRAATISYPVKRARPPASTYNL
jgi:hypothetical protein